jgi:hypothetical protein
MLFGTLLVMSAFGLLCGCTAAGGVWSLWPWAADAQTVLPAIVGAEAGLHMLVLVCPQCVLKL